MTDSHLTDIERDRRSVFMTPRLAKWRAITFYNNGAIAQAVQNKIADGKVDV